MHEILPFRLTAEARIRLIVKKCPAFGAVVERVCLLDGGDAAVGNLADRLEGENTPETDRLSALLKRLPSCRKLALADFLYHTLPVLKTSWSSAAIILEHGETPAAFAESELKLLEARNPATLDIWWNLATDQETDEAEFTVHYAAACVAKLHRTHLASYRLEKKTANASG
jgi:hypothetical protein